MKPKRMKPIVSFFAQHSEHSFFLAQHLEEVNIYFDAFYRISKVNSVFILS